MQLNKLNLVVKCFVNELRFKFDEMESSSPRSKKENCSRCSKDFWRKKKRNEIGLKPLFSLVTSCKNFVNYN